MSISVLFYSCSIAPQFAVVLEIQQITAGSMLQSSLKIAVKILRFGQLNHVCELCENLNLCEISSISQFFFKKN